MPDAQYELELEASRLNLTEGTLILIEKTREKKGKHSPVGTLKRGHIKSNLEYKQPLLFQEWGDTCVTSDLQKIFIENGKIYIETITSLYEVTFPEK